MKRVSKKVTFAETKTTDSKQEWIQDPMYGKSTTFFPNKLVEKDYTQKILSQFKELSIK